MPRVVASHPVSGALSGGSYYVRVEFDEGEGEHQHALDMARLEAALAGWDPDSINPGFPERRQSGCLSVACSFPHLAPRRAET